MKIRNQEVLWVKRTPTQKEEVWRFIEECGRNCYQSFDKMDATSHLRFVRMLYENKHSAMLEFGNLVVMANINDFQDTSALFKNNLVVAAHKSKYLTMEVEGDDIYVFGNYRAFWEALKCQFDELPGCVPEPFKMVSDEEIPLFATSVTVKLLTDRAVTHEIVRHRPCSFAQESQRYCAYLEELLFIYQWWWANLDTNDYKDVCDNLFHLEKMYKSTLAKLKEKYGHGNSAAQEARAFLPNCTASNIVMSGYIHQWEHIFNLRGTGAAYPQMRHLMTPVKNEFVRNGWVLA